MYLYVLYFKLLLLYYYGWFLHKKNKTKQNNYHWEPIDTTARHGKESCVLKNCYSVKAIKPNGKRYRQTRERLEDDRLIVSSYHGLNIRCIPLQMKLKEKTYTGSPLLWTLVCLPELCASVSIWTNRCMTEHSMMTADPATDFTHFTAMWNSADISYFICIYLTEKLYKDVWPTCQCGELKLK